ncbi:Calcium-channel protein cch1 [Leucoagaricus sp. SymC.cos]|nr:Calcium-channel protein cch1 [Leucoagaricus sp. SymC.cos]
METNDIYLHKPNSSSSAVDLSGTGLSAPPSPALEPSESRVSLSRRRSWSHRLVEPGQDPLRLNLAPDTSQAVQSDPIKYPNEDPFLDSPTEDRASKGYPYTADVVGYNGRIYGSSQAEYSTASLIVPDRFQNGHREDDEAVLTRNMSRNGQEEVWADGDPEQSFGSARRRTLRYSASPSPLKKTGSVIRNVSQNIRRVSLRVVNLAGSGLENQLRLGDGDDGPAKVDDEEEDLPDLSKVIPIRGRTLGFLGADSKLRLGLYSMLVYPWTEPFILILIVLNAVVLTIQASPSLTLPSDPPAPPPHIKGYFHTWEDWVLFALFCIFSLEAFARICVTGFLFDPEIKIPFALHSRTPVPLHDPTPSQPQDPQQQPSADGTVTEKTFSAVQNTHDTIRNAPEKTFLSRAMRSDDNDLISLPFRLSVQHIHEKTRRGLPYLRQSWNRIDFVAIVSFWIMFGLAMAGVERGRYHIGLFRAMSVIRTARLLTMTSGTTTIMHSLKTARPLLTNVAYFVLFAMVLFSIIGVQSFKGSLRRSCVLVGINGEDNIQLDQFCGGHIDPETLNESGYQTPRGEVGATKGYICPLGQICMEEPENPNDNIESFDAIWYSALQVVITATANGWTPLMYAMIDSEFFVSCFFFILCVVVLNFWLINLFVAVITNTFAAIRSETKKSAFGAAPLIPVNQDEQDEAWDMIDNHRNPRRNQNWAKIIYDHTRWCWVLLALASLALQASRQVDISPTHLAIMYYGELGITIAFDIEIVIRIFACLPEWRSFWISGRNILDLSLAVGCSVIQIPVIQESSVYEWFTILQLARFYRVILEIPRMKPLLLAVFGNLYGLANMSLFLILINYISALVAVQLLRGDYTDSEATNFGELWNAFLAIWQVFSSENWTDVLYGATSAEIQLGQTLIVIIFIVSWMLFANFIVLQMFIAVINENFDVAEEAKKSKQASNFWAMQKAREGKPSWMRVLNPYRWFKASPVTVRVDELPSGLVLPMQKNLVVDYGPPGGSVANVAASGSGNGNGHGEGAGSEQSLNALEKLFAGETRRTNDIPLATLRHARQPQPQESELGTHVQEEVERHLELLALINPEQNTIDDFEEELNERRAQKADFIRDHPSYDKVFWIIPQKNWVRKFCQKVVQPARGERIFGTRYSPIAHPIFQLVILLTVIGGIVVEGIATPIYRRNYYNEHGLIRGAWFDIAEAAFGLTLFVEFMIKVIADGFIWTPNAYLRSIWNFLDFAIMIGIIVNVTTGLIFIGGLSRLTRSMKALRALRMITLIDRMRNTFQSLIISGVIRILDAAVLAILYMIPYAVWGLNIFAGKMRTCNDPGNNVNSMSDCIGEYENAVVGDGNSFGFLVPRVWDNPSLSTTFSFDSFRTSLLILFEIVSLEGWTDVMFTATTLTGRDLQPQTNASQANAIFFLIYNLLGGVVILTLLFVSIIIGNFSSKTGSAFLTQPQREWIDLQKLFKRQKPSKRPIRRPTRPIRAWCYDRAIQKHGWWSRSMTALFLLHIFALIFPLKHTYVLVNLYIDDFFLALMFIYIIDVIVRCYGLGWRSFRANGWNLFDIVIAFGSFVTTLVVRFGNTSFAVQQLQKLFLVSIAFKLVQRTNSLNMLFKTAVSSLPVILSLLGLWLILFIFFAILFVEVFSLTKWSNRENRNQNYSSLGSALVMLAFMSAGEGWNGYMHDYDLTYPRCTNSLGSLAESDCGSTAWAFTLFIAWNLLSMYIFVNMFTGVVVENFSYVFQASGRGAKSISREQMRSFKKLWAEYANPKGYLERHHFSAFFSRLSGVFEVKIYPSEFNTPNVKMSSLKSRDPATIRSTRPYDLSNFDLKALSKTLDKMDRAAIRKRKATYSRLYHEAIISHRPGVGISFTDMLLLLAHHKLIVDGEALVLKDLVVRTEVNKVVNDLVNLDRVRSLLMTISQRRWFLAQMEEKRAAAARADHDIPFIVVDSMPESPVPSTRDIVSAAYGISPPTTPTPGEKRPDISFALDGSKLQRSSWRNSELSITAAFRSPRTSVAEEDPQDILMSMQNSMWGDVMRDAAQESERH